MHLKKNHFNFLTSSICLYIMYHIKILKIVDFFLFVEIKYRLMFGGFNNRYILFN